jgi:hypothetical protein
MKNFLIYPKSHNPEKHPVIYQPIFVAKDTDLIELDKAYNICDLQGKAVDIKALKKEASKS